MKQHRVRKHLNYNVRFNLFAFCFVVFVSPVKAGNGLNQDADEILRNMSDFLANTQAFSVDAEINNEIINVDGQKLQFNSQSSLLVDRPSRIHMKRKGRFANVEFIYDGNRMTIYSSTMNAYLQHEIAGTIDDAIIGLESITGLSLPGADLLLSDSYDALTSGLLSSGYYGTAHVSGVKSHHLAFRAEEYDWQLWVKVGDEPLPMKYVITSKWITGAPQFSVQLNNWDLKPEITRNIFQFSAENGVRKINAINVDQAGEIVLPKESK